MKIGEVMGLKLSGYSIDEIKEIGQYADADPEVITAAKELKNMDELRSLIELAGNAQAPSGGNAGKDPEADSGKNEDPGNLAEQLEAEKKRAKDLEEELAKAQKENLTRDNSGRGEDASLAAENTFIDMINEL